MAVLKPIRNAFISGLLLLAPVGVTLFVINFLIQRVGGPTRQFVFFFIPPQSLNIWIEYGLYLLSIIVVVAIITLLGWLSKHILGRAVLSLFERIVDNLPFIRTVYNTVKQIRDTFVQQEKAVFQRVVLVEYPRRGTYAIGFITGQGKGEVQERTEADLVNVFVPSTPNPTSGFLLMVPRNDMIPLKMSVGDGMKLIVSGGAVVPRYDPVTGATVAGPAERVPLPSGGPESLPRA